MAEPSAETPKLGSEMPKTRNHRPLFEIAAANTGIDLSNPSKDLGGPGDWVNRVVSVAEHMHRNLYWDELTGLRNRKWLKEYLPAWLEKKDPNATLAVTATDLDRLTDINNTYGHDGGDRALMMSAYLIKLIHPDGVNVRLGGDEYATVDEVSADQTEIEYAESFKKRLQEILRPMESDADTEYRPEVTKMLRDLDIGMDSVTRHILAELSYSAGTVFIKVSELKNDGIWTNLKVADGRLYEDKKSPRHNQPRLRAL